jgi:hypothetical protein
VACHAAAKVPLILTEFLFVRYLLFPLSLDTFMNSNPQVMPSGEGLLLTSLLTSKLAAPSSFSKL